MQYLCGAASGGELLRGRFEVDMIPKGHISVFLCELP